ncbi:MAG TPA: phosphoribosylanthranilate isomerase [Candidatus Saccharimonadales bacterium]|nr:phosphoribosylanthranilate isomerase [Candidatus Saccharimonadales bacterium]
MSAVQIKICGITRVPDALEAVALGVEMLGLNFYAESPRFVSIEQAQRIAEAVAGRIKVVGVFVNMNVEEVLEIARAVPLDFVQLHGDESLNECEAIANEFEVIRALKVDAQFTPECASEFAFCSGLMLDTPSTGFGGAGESFDWARVDWSGIRGASPFVDIYLAGGLNAGNVGEAIEIVRPDVVDVCSGVEAEKGVKSASRMREFVAAARAAEGLEQ